MKYILLFIKQTLRFILKPLSFLPAIIMMCLIFSFSSQSGNESGQLSYDTGIKLYSFANEELNLGWSSAQIVHYSESTQFYIRKAAHITEYFLLAVSVAFPLYVYGVRGIALVLIAGVFCVGYASMDEFHQSFISGRTPAKRDVLIDSIGILIGIFFVRIFGWLGRMTIFRPLANHKKDATW